MIKNVNKNFDLNGLNYLNIIKRTVYLKRAPTVSDKLSFL